VNQKQRVSLQSAFVLHKRPYRESSLLLDVFSYDYGKIGLVARGVRKNRRGGAAVLEPFNLLRLSWTGKSDLQTMTSVELIPPGLRLTGKSLYCGFYLNELLNYFLHRHDPHPNLFSHYAATLVSLSENPEVETALRYFELALLDETGFGLQIECDSKTGAEVEAGKRYRYWPGEGLVESNWSVDSIGGSTLISLVQRKLGGAEQLTEAKCLMRMMIDHYLGEKTLRSRFLFKARNEWA
jgi:DNA repair protein RecO (recombination protein O)